MVAKMNATGDMMAVARLKRQYPDDTPRQRRLRL
jgi:hypothetical protein